MASLVAEQFIDTIKRTQQWIEYDAKTKSKYKKELSNYVEFWRCTTGHFIPKAYVGTEYISQGCNFVGSNALITYYSSKGNNSVLSIVDEYGEGKNLTLDNKSHVGGVAYHEKSGKVYISNDSKINVYDIDTISNTQNGSVLKSESQIELGYNVDTSSYITVNGDNLYVGKFEKEGGAYVEIYDLDKNGNVSTNKEGKALPREICAVPFPQVQGMCVCTNDKNETFYVFSCSYGRKNDSILRIAKLERGNFEPCATTITLPCMAEQVSVDSDNKLCVVFESDSEKYGKGVDGKGCSTTQISDVVQIDIDNILNKL